MYTVTKHYPHSLGLSCVFRQPGAQSHCRYLHGYAFAVTLVFEAQRRDENNWVLDFGSLKPVKAWLQETFDHRLLVAYGDPKRIILEELQDNGLAQVLVVPAIGCEAFANMIGEYVIKHLRSIGETRARLRSCTVAEHEGNAATWEPDYVYDPLVRIGEGHPFDLAEHI